MRFRLRNLFLIMALAAVVLTVYARRPLDGYGGSLWATALGDNTVWAPGYTDGGFRAIKSGMKRSEVYALIGQPLGSYSEPTGEVVESWTEMGELNESTHYDCSVHFRTITFRGDVVVEKVAEFSPD